MPKLTVFEKNENKNQKSINASLDESSLTIDESDLLDLGMFDSEKTNNNESKQNSQIDTNSARAKFDELLSEAVDETLSLLGEPVKNTVYFQLENSFSIPKKEIPKQIDEFSDIMHKIFGFGACRFEINLMKNLYSKINTDFKLPDYESPLSKWVITDMSFSEYVFAARKSYIEKRQGSE